MTVPANDEIIFHGYWLPGGKPVIVIETMDGQEIGPLKHIVRHSPTGLGWGYTGSGPADTARSLLLAALGPAGFCARCGGTGQVICAPEQRTVTGFIRCDLVLNPRNLHVTGQAVARCRDTDCEDGYRPVPYQRFQRDVVTSWGWEWHISRTDVLAWLGPDE